MRTARIEPVPGTSFAENKDAAKALRESVILPALAAGEAVVLDFSAVETTTQSFVHALISDAVRRYGEEGIPRLRFKGCNGEVRQLVTTVVEYTLMAADAAADLDRPAQDEYPPE